MDEKKYSEALRQKYQLVLDSREVPLLRFEDGVEYTIPEAMQLSRGADNDTIRAVHAVKKIFHGELLIPGVNYEAYTPQGWKADRRYEARSRQSGAPLSSKREKGRKKIEPDALPCELFARD